jgi:hypothetical protein
MPVIAFVNSRLIMVQALNCEVKILSADLMTYKEGIFFVSRKG